MEAIVGTMGSTGRVGSDEEDDGIPSSFQSFTMELRGEEVGLDLMALRGGRGGEG